MEIKEKLVALRKQRLQRFQLPAIKFLVLMNGQHGLRGLGQFLKDSVRISLQLHQMLMADSVTPLCMPLEKLIGQERLRMHKGFTI